LKKMQKTKNRIALSHPVGNHNVKGVLMGFQENDILHSFHTSVACFLGSWLDKLAQFPLLKDFKRRGFNTDILKLMASQDVFVFPSLFEGFGLVITEAMSQGTPVISTD